MKKVVMGAVVLGVMFGMTSMAHAAVVDFYAVADAEITGTVAGSYVNTHNWGGLDYLAGNINRAGTDGPTSANFPNYGDSRGLLKFDLSSIPTGAVIDSATVKLYVGGNAFSPITSRLTSVSLYRVTSDWTEDLVTYDTRPAWNSTAVATLGIPAATGTVIKTPYNGYITAQITNLVQDWVDGDSENFGLVTSDTYTQYGLLRLYAHEASGTNYDPVLSVTYTLPPPTATPEPASMLLFGMGLAGLVTRRFRSKTV